MNKLYRKDSNGCWIWQGSLFATGYGCYKKMFAHRAFYELYNGGLKPNHHIHHLCHIKLCVNPSHLKQIPKREHAKLHRQTERETCKHGHFMKNNTYITKAGHWQCMRCNADRQDKYRLESTAPMRAKRMAIVDGVRKDYGTMPVKDIANKYNISWRSIYRYIKADPKRVGYL